MTESEWFAASDYRDLLAVWRPHMSERKQRLYACAVARETEHLVRDRRCMRAIELAERFADGLVSAKELKAAHNDVNAAYWQCATTWQAAAWARLAYLSATQESDPLMGHVFGNATTAIQLAAVKQPMASGLERDSVRDISCGCRRCVRCLARDDADRRFAVLLRDIMPFPPVFQRLTLSNEFSSDAVVKLAKSIYNDRRFEQCAVLGDLLADTGQSEHPIVVHLKSDAPHRLGCWAIDIILGKK